MIALSVSTVATTSPRSTLSPSSFSQLTTTPSVMVSESWGILITWMVPSGRCSSAGPVAVAAPPAPSWAESDPTAGGGCRDSAAAGVAGAVSSAPFTSSLEATSQAMGSPTGTVLSTGARGPER